ncbi:MAG TPA: hypothetical protein VNN18_12105 [Candidatus Xenobia bacterium]|nr:hypothetical protein [Candidatus Xenobia bacterium]
MSARSVFRAAGLALLILSCAGPALAQRPGQLYGVEEYNAFVDTTRPTDPNEKLAAIDAFLKAYPNSVLRAFVLPEQAKALFQLKRYEKAMDAIEAFLQMNREQVVALLKQSQYNDLQIDSAYYYNYLLYAHSYSALLGTNATRAQALTDAAIKRVNEGLELHQRLYGTVTPPADAAQREQFEKTRAQEESTFRSLLADATWRKKDYPAASREYANLVKKAPNDAVLNYRLGLSYLLQQPPVWEQGLWHVARAVALNIPKSDEVKEFLSKNVSAYQQVVPECSGDQVNDLVALAAQSADPPAGWKLVSSEQVAAVRNDLSLKRIFDDLKAGGEAEHIIWLASCGAELPEIEAEVVQVSQNEGNVVTLGVAVTAESAEAGKADMVVKVIAPPEAKNIKTGDIVHITGTLRSYQKDPEFQLVLSDGRIKPEDIPKTRGRSGAGR